MPVLEKNSFLKCHTSDPENLIPDGNMTFILHFLPNHNKSIPDITQGSAFYPKEAILKTSQPVIETCGLRRLFNSLSTTAKW